MSTSNTRFSMFQAADPHIADSELMEHVNKGLEKTTDLVSHVNNPNYVRPLDLIVAGAEAIKSIVKASLAEIPSIVNETIEQMHNISEGKSDEERVEKKPPPTLTYGM